MRVDEAGRRRETGLNCLANSIILIEVSTFICVQGFILEGGGDLTAGVNMTIVANGAGIKGGGFHIHDLATRRASAVFGINMVVRDNWADEYG